MDRSTSVPVAQRDQSPVSAYPDGQAPFLKLRRRIKNLERILCQLLLQHGPGKLYARGQHLWIEFQSLSEFVPVQLCRRTSAMYLRHQIMRSCHCWRYPECLVQDLSAFIDLPGLEIECALLDKRFRVIRIFDQRSREHPHCIGHLARASISRDEEASEMPFIRLGLRQALQFFNAFGQLPAVEQEKSVRGTEFRLTQSRDFPPGLLGSVKLSKLHLHADQPKQSWSKARIQIDRP